MKEQSFAMKSLIDSVVAVSESTRRVAVEGPRTALEELRRKVAALNVAVEVLAATEGASAERPIEEPRAPLPTAREKEIFESIDDVFGATGLY